MTQPEAVLFDKDGTILPFSPFWTTWTRTFRDRISEFGVLDRVAPGMLDWPANTRTASHGASVDVATMEVLRERIVGLLVSVGTDAKDAQRIVGSASRTADAVAGALPIEAHEGFVEAVHVLSSHGIAMGVVTGDDEARAARQMHAIGLIRALSVVVGGDRGLPGKPAPATLLAACRELDVAPERCVYVGDSLVDVLAARAAGFSAALVYVPHDAEALPSWAGEADEVIRDFGILAGMWSLSPSAEQ